MSENNSLTRYRLRHSDCCVCGELEKLSKGSSRTKSSCPPRPCRSHPTAGLAACRLRISVTIVASRAHLLGPLYAPAHREMARLALWTALAAVLALAAAAVQVCTVPDTGPAVVRRWAAHLC